MKREGTGAELIDDGEPSSSIPPSTEATPEPSLPALAPVAAKPEPVPSPTATPAPAQPAVTASSPAPDAPTKPSPEQKVEGRAVESSSLPPFEQEVSIPKFDISKFRAQAIVDLTKHYSLDEKTREAYLEDPSAVLPKLLAQAHVNAVDAALHMVQQFLPQALQGYTSQAETQRSLTQRFYDRWPALRAHHPTVTKLLKAHRAVSPQDTLEELIENVGLQASVKLKLPLQGVVAAPAATQPSQPSPFTPAAPGGATRPKPASSNVWAEFTEED